MRVNRRQLAAKLNVSERSLATWLHQGMPAMRSGYQGRANVFDLGEVVDWCRRNEKGLDLNTGIQRIPFAQLDQELTKPAPARERAIARAIALARLKTVTEFPPWGFPEVKFKDLADLLSLYISELSEELSKAGLP